MGFRYRPYPFQKKKEEAPPPTDSGYSGISGIKARLDNIPQIPQIPESGVPPAIESNPLEDGSDLERMARATFQQTIEQEKQLLRFSDEKDFVGMNIGIAMTYILDLLPQTIRIFYVGFTGAKGSGKSTATSICARLCNNGIKLEGVTYPALADACKKKKTLCLDEFDSQSEKCPELETIVRQGIDLDAHYCKLVQDGKGLWVPDDVPCGGMKFINWRNPIDDALLQRILVIKMAPGASTRMIVNNEAPDRFTSPIKCWFSAQSAKAHENWTPERVRNLIEDKDNVLTEKLDALLGVLPRQMQKGFWMLVVCEIFGWDFDATIKHLIEKQPEDEAYEDYKELVIEIYAQRRELTDADAQVVLTLTDFKKDMAQRVKDKGLYPLRQKGALSWTGLRQECGFVEGVSEKKDSKKSGKRILIFDERVQRSIGIDKTKQTNLDGG